MAENGGLGFVVVGGATEKEKKKMNNLFTKPDFDLSQQTYSKIKYTLPLF